MRLEDEKEDEIGYLRFLDEAGARATSGLDNLWLVGGLSQ
ncbi:uncharacterized protein CLUP02_12200 [Colletotrichum lupini]|uniref:Uncharacterized protein n=1 Tax=Colletotrichum lupini TaxID=145971 RepID=A0A9Q8T014_9PEZI|nr:uncharacterized protein CLUP02_12200 [Colletotrichum lupini]UQC86698.1 hypothetical protein CLUP02_12200 [Colletotrichum lupini]